MDTAYFLAGAAKTDITPPLGTLINGDFVAHYARYIHDPLYAKALVMKDPETTIVFVVVDICAMDKDFLDDVKGQVFLYAGLEPEKVMISSTHTHAAGSITDLLLVAPDLAYRKNLAAQIVAAVLGAKENLRPARLAFGSVDAPEHVVCRRYFMKAGYEARNPVTGGLDKVKTNPSGDEDQIEGRVSRVDTGLSYLAIRGMDDRWIALLANYSLHYVGDWAPGTITADYFGLFATQLSTFLGAGDEFIGIMTNGTSGEVNILDFLQPDRYPMGPLEKSKAIAVDIAQKLVRSLKDITWETRPALYALYEQLPVTVRRPSPVELEEAGKIVAETDYAKLVLKDSHTGNEDGFKRIYAREQVLLDRYPWMILFPIQVIKIGPVILGGLGGEFFSETGLWLKHKLKGQRYFTVCLANGYVGYVPPRHEMELGGYETWRCRTSFLEEDAEEKIKWTLLRLVRAIRKKHVSKSRESR